MNTEETKIQSKILIDILIKKEKYLEEILNITTNQTTILEYKPIDSNLFDALSQEKAIRTKKINELDEGFEGIYASIREELQESPKAFAKEIKSMQNIIYKISDLDIKISLQEEKNRQLLMTNSIKGKSRAVEVYKQNIIFNKRQK